MRTIKKSVSVLLVVVLTLSIFLTGCGKGGLGDFFTNLFGGKKSEPAERVTSEVQLPDRPYVIEEQKDDAPDSLPEYLAGDEVAADEFLSSKELEEQIISADFLEDVADSKTEVDNLRKLKDSFLSLLNAADSGMSSETREKIDKLADKIDFLLTEGILSSSQLKAATPFKGTWSKPDKVILRWTPQNEWVPEDGYNLYRKLDGKTELIAEGLGNEEHIELSIALNNTYSEYIKPLFDNSKAGAEEFQEAGVLSEDKLNDFILKNAVTVKNKYRFSGAEDFKRTYNNSFEVKGSLIDKIPFNDLYDFSPLHTKAQIKVVPISLNTQSELEFKAYNPELVLASDVEKTSVIAEMLENRNNMLTKANIDIEFANASGFGYEDNLSELKIAKNDPIEYTLVPQKPELKVLNITSIASGTKHAGTYSVIVSYGVETLVEDPQNFDGYGANNTVYLRWSAPIDDYAKSIISGYYIERKKKGESSFIRLNDVPVAISYTQDENGIFYEVPVFYMDETLVNGDEAIYRVQSLDIFGRVSEYSTELDLKVYKVLPPNTPNVGQPELSSRKLEKLAGYYKEIAQLNKTKTGIILPISKTSEDTVQFAIFRSKAIGSGTFEAPVEIARIPVEEQSAEITQKIINYKSTKLIVQPSGNKEVHTVYFDADVQKGSYYKYWVASVDEWGNESPWSGSRVIGYPTEEKPLHPSDAFASMERNTVPNQTIEIPGFESGRIINPTTEKLLMKTDYKKLAEENNIVIGKSISESVRAEFYAIPDILSLQYSNLPDTKDIHDIIALEEKDLLPGGTALVSWYHYAGQGISGYHVYRALVDNKSLSDLNNMSREEITDNFTWSLVSENTLQNQIIDNVTQKSGRIYLYMIFLVPESNGFTELKGFNFFIPGGWVNLKWSVPEDPQLDYYRVYKSEVPYFFDDINTDSLEWTMVCDNQKFNGYTEKVDQTFAHYYYYKITSVSVWGEESQQGTITRIRVPATSPPQTPSMLLPFSQKGKVQIKWVGVPHASKYVVYRRKLPKIKEEDIVELQNISPDLFNKVFLPSALADTFITERILPVKGNLFIQQPNTNISRAGERVEIQITQDVSIPLVNKFNTLQLVTSKTSLQSIKQVSIKSKVAIYQNIVTKYGPLAISPYGQLDYEMAKLVIWEKVHELSIPPGQDSTGVFDFTDSDVDFGDTYLYTVQAVNDDELTSGMPDPVSVSPRKSAPFPPVTGLKGLISNDYNMPQLTWNAAKEPNLNWKESREFTAGYIVYKSNNENGQYYQASELLTDTSFLDRNADINSANWYKVKVVDTGGFISDFSSAVKVQKAPDFLIPQGSLKIVIPQSKLKISRSGFDRDNMTLSLQLQPIKPITPITPIVPLIPDTLTINGFTVTGLSQETLNTGNGSGMLKIGEEYQAEVNVNISKRDGTVITRGSVSLKQPVGFEDTGVYISTLKIETANPAPGSKIGGYIKSTGSGNLFGDLYSLKFENAELTPSGIIKISGSPVFHYDNLTFHNPQMITINLTGSSAAPKTGGSPVMMLVNPLIYGSFLVTFIGGQLENNLGMETLDNKGLLLSYSMIGFDKDGQLEGTFNLVKTQVVRAVIPAGLGIRVTSAKLVYKNGSADSAQSSISGKVLLPFNTFEDSLPVELDASVLLNTYSKTNKNISDYNLNNTLLKSDSSSINLTTAQAEIVDKNMYYLASRIQSFSLKVLPMDIAVQETLSTVPFSVGLWNGTGFLVAETTMTPALVGNTDEEIGVTPGKVALDLTRQDAYTGTSPEDTKNPDWMGIVVKNGRVGLPPAFIKTDNDTRVLFNLTPGELLYDRNGVFYQNQAYSAEGIPVNFGDALGGFKDVIVNLIYLDIYNNKVNLEIQGEMGIPLFGYQRAKVRLYTSKELGKLVCSVAETEKFDPSGSGEVILKILGGHLQEDGLHMDGTLDLNFEGKLVQQDIQFTELIIPSDMESMTEAGNSGGIYGKALFDKPYRIKFHDFEMDIRSLSMLSLKQEMQLQLLQPIFQTGYKRDVKIQQGITLASTSTISFYKTTMSLWGGMQLSDNLAMDNNEDFDRVVLSNVFMSPDISYEESKSKLELNFEEFAQVQTVATPVVSSSDDGIVEYNTDALEFAFNSASMISPVPIEANVRMGYDKNLSRYFFALAIYYHDPSGGISFGYGTINDITGVIGYNLDLPYDSAEGYSFPNQKDGFFNSIDNLAINRTPGGNYFFAATAWMYLGYDAGSVTVKLGEIRNLYLVVEKGPIVEMGGDYYGPGDIQALITGNGLKLMGTARLGYYHPDRLFKFSLSLYDFGMYGCTVSGDLGFDMCPKYWEVRIGYPTPLTAKMGGFTGGFGIAVRNSDYPDDSFVKATMFFSYDTGDITIWPVYFRAYLHIGGGGEYYFDSGNLVLYVFIEGGLEGGIKVGGKKYRIIHLSVGAEGTLTRYTGKWNLDASMRIHYHLDLFLLEVGGSIKWHISKDF